MAEAPGSQSKKRKPPSSELEAVWKRYKKWKAGNSTTKGKIDLYYCNEEDKIELFNKMKSIKTYMGDGNPNTVTTFEMMDRVLDFYLLMNSNRKDVGKQLQGKFSAAAEYTTAEYTTAEYTTAEYTTASKGQAVDDELFICTLSSLKHLAQQMEKHQQGCCKELECDKYTRLHHGLQVTLKCPKRLSFTWTSSPHLPGGKLLVNVRRAHAFFSSGMLPNQLEKFCTEGGVGLLGVKYLDHLQSTYSKVVEGLAAKSTEEAMHGEIASEEANESCAEGINILTHARHCWRKNAKSSDVVCLGQRTHKVLRVETVTKSVEKSS